MDTFLTLTQYRLRKTILLFWSWITFRGKEKKIKPTVGLNYRKNKVPAQTGFCHSDKHFKSCCRKPQDPQGLPIPCMGPVSQDIFSSSLSSAATSRLWGEIVSESLNPNIPCLQHPWTRSRTQMCSRYISCFFTATLTPAIISFGSELSPLVHHNHWIYVRMGTDTANAWKFRWVDVL